MSQRVSSYEPAIRRQTEQLFLSLVPARLVLIGVARR